MLDEKDRYEVFWGDRKYNGSSLAHWAKGSPLPIDNSATESLMYGRSVLVKDGKLLTDGLVKLILHTNRVWTPIQLISDEADNLEATAVDGYASDVNDQIRVITRPDMILRILKLKDITISDLLEAFNYLHKEGEIKDYLHTQLTEGLDEILHGAESETREQHYS